MISIPYPLLPRPETLLSHMPFYTSLNLQPITIPNGRQLPNIINVLVYIPADSGFGTDIDTNESKHFGKASFSLVKY